MRMLRFLFFFALLPVSFAGDLPHASPADVGFRSDGLEKISRELKTMIDSGTVAGASALVYRKGKVVYFEQFGMANLENKTPMKPDSLFRIYSMTKPVTSAAALLLVEEGKLKLDDPVHQYLPGLQDVQVFQNKDGGEPAYLAPKRPITIRDLFLHTSGMTYGLFGNTPVDDLYKKSTLSQVKNSAEFVEVLGTLPLLAQPGTFWNYGVSIDVLGLVIEKVSSKPLNAFMAERVFKPLGMTDSSFSIVPKNKERMAEVYMPQGGKLVHWQEGITRFTDVTLYSGGGGLISSVHDYLRFTRMILGNGTLDGKRFLKAETVKLMVTNQLPEEAYPIGFGALRYQGHGFGLGFAVLHEPQKSNSKGNQGLAYWSGYANTYFFIDPQTETIGMLMTQHVPFGLGGLGNRFQGWVFGAMAE